MLKLGDLEKQTNQNKIILVLPFIKALIANLLRLIISKMVKFNCPLIRVYKKMVLGSWFCT